MPPPPPAAEPTPAESQSETSASEAPASASSSDSKKTEAKEKKGFGWLLNRSKSAQAPLLAELLQEKDSSDGEVPTVYLRAVASELCVDAPSGVFDGTEGLKVVPASVPVATRSLLLHAAVKSEAEKLKPKLAAEGAVSVAKSMIRELVERAADIKDPKEKREALDQIVLLSESSQSLASSVAPDVEVGTPVYDGPLRYKTLEQMFDVYLDGVMEGVQQQTKAMMQAFSGGEDASGAQPSVAEMTARAEQADKAQTTLAAIFKISEGKVQKLLDKKGEKMQKDLLGGLLSGEA